MKTNTRIAQLEVAASKWDEAAKDEVGKTPENGWSPRELFQAESRRFAAESNAHSCRVEIERLRKEPNP
jgi:hypothetical protein